MAAINNATGMNDQEVRINPPGAATADATNITESIVYNDSNKVMEVSILFGSNDAATFPVSEHNPAPVNVGASETHTFLMSPGEAIQFTNTVTGTADGNVVINPNAARVRHLNASRTYPNYRNRNAINEVGAIVMGIITT